MPLKSTFYKNPLFKTYHSPPLSAKSVDPPMSPIQETVVITIDPQINQIVTPRSPRTPRDEQQVDATRITIV